jgi:hypothetical protein
VNSLNRTFGTGRTRTAARAIAATALATTVLVSASGCALISTQATTISYSPSDGILVPESGPIEVRNVLIVANEEGTEGNLIAAFVNATDETHTVNMEFGEAGDGVTESVRVPANTVISLGVDGNEPILLEGLELLPGSDVPASFQSGDGDTALVNVPVLDGAQDYLEPFVP